jgi:hypothetical protein
MIHPKRGTNLNLLVESIPILELIGIGLVEECKIFETIIEVRVGEW